MKAAILCIGSELLFSFRTDTNSRDITDILWPLGVEVTSRAIVGDDRKEIARAMAYLSEGVELLVVTGGIGPTRDDVTREAAADLLGVQLVMREDLLGGIEAFYRVRGRAMHPGCRRQAMIPEGAEPVMNDGGTAPGFRFTKNDCGVWCLPGVPHEMRRMVERDLVPPLRKLGLSAPHQIRLRMAGRPESECEAILAPYYERYGRDGFTILSGAGSIEMILTSPDRQVLRERSEMIHNLFPGEIYTESGAGQEEALVALLIRKQVVMAAAESCTGGLLAVRITSVPGASRVFRGCVVAYDNRVKEETVDVPRGVLDSHGAVSEPVARAMAEGVSDRLGADLGVGITGIAGPGGGTAEKPVGTVHIAVAFRGQTFGRRYLFPGDRERVRWFAVESALRMARKALS